MKEKKTAATPCNTFVRSEIASLVLNNEDSFYANASTQLRQMTMNSFHDNHFDEVELPQNEQGMCSFSNSYTEESFNGKTQGKKSVNDSNRQSETRGIETKKGHITDDINKSNGDRTDEIKYCQKQQSAHSMERSDSLNMCCKTQKEDVNKKEKLKTYQNLQSCKHDSFLSKNLQEKASEKYVPHNDAQEKRDSNKADFEGKSRTIDDEKAKYEKIIGLVVDKRKETNRGKVYETQLQKQQDIENKDSEDIDNRTREEHESGEVGGNKDEETSIKSESDPMNQKLQEEQRPHIFDKIDNEAPFSIDREETGRYRSIMENSWNSMEFETLDVTENSWYPESLESLLSETNLHNTCTIINSMKIDKQVNGLTERKDCSNLLMYIMRKMKDEKMKEDPTAQFENSTFKGRGYDIQVISLKIQEALSAKLGHHPDKLNKPSKDTTGDTLFEKEAEIEKDLYEAKEKDTEFEGKFKEQQEIGDEPEKQSFNSFEDAKENEKEIIQEQEKVCEMLEKERIDNDCTPPFQVKVVSLDEEVFQSETKGKGTERLSNEVKEIGLKLENEMNCKPDLSCIGVEEEIDNTKIHESFDTEENVNKDIANKTKENVYMIDECYGATVCEVGKAELKDGLDEFADKPSTERRTKSKRSRKKHMNIENLKVELEMKKQLDGIEGFREALKSYAKGSLSCKSNSHIKENNTNRPLSLIQKSKEMDCEMFLPKTRRGQRCLRILRYGGNGRTFSDTSSDSGGSLKETNDSGKGSSRQGNKNEDQNNNHSDKGNNSDNRKNGRDPNDGERPGRAGSPDPTLNQQRRTSTDGAKVPEQDYKRYRRKHSDISEEHWEKFLGYLKEKSKEKGSPCWDLYPNPVATCLALCMEQTEDLSDDMLECVVCLTTNSLLKHYSNCTSAYIGCDICTQIFSLLCCHVKECTNRSANFNCSTVSCTIPLCFKIRITLTGSDISSHLMMLWFNIRKKLSRVIGDVEAVIEKKPVTRKHSGNPHLVSIPENGVPSYTPNSRPGSRVLARKMSNLNIVVEEKTDGNKSVLDGRRKSFEGELNDVVSDAVPLSTQGNVRRETFTSLPMGPPLDFERQFRSFEDRPVGIKGIGEVVYGSKNQLIKVAQYWDKKKKEYQDTGKLRVQYREEGVILEQFKDMLVIGEVRYQKDFQWIKDSALGNGMSGKCSLATDFNSDAKFCVKEIHIASYEMDEVALWTDLDLPYIVQLYGAIRLGERVFIFMEYIAGGCLTEAINHQRELGQRLSQATALKYFQQLLEVLVYLKTKNILHEDLKGDNILLHRVGNNVSIKVTDFGASRICHGQGRKGTKPTGTETQWSPEKAEATSYSFPAELWAAIVDHSPPLEDIPRNISDSLRDLIERGFTVCPGMRPLPQQMLLHDAFRTLVNSPGNEIYSMLGPGLQSMACIEDDLSKDLREIYRNLGGTSPDRKDGPFVQPSTTVQVYTALIEKNGADNQIGAVGEVTNQTANQMGAVGGAYDQESGAVGGVSNPGGRTGQGSRLSPSDPSRNIDPTQHLKNYLNDTSTPGIPDIPGNNLVVYNPDLTTMHAGNLHQQHEENQIPSIISDEALDCVLPHFDEILGSNIMDEGYYHVDSDEEEEEDDFFKGFELNKALKELNISKEDETSQGERNSVKSDIMEKKEAKGISASKYTPKSEEDKQEHHELQYLHLDSVNNEDDLFGSGRFDPKSQDNASQTSSSGVALSYNQGAARLSNTQESVTEARFDQTLNTNAKYQGEQQPSRQVQIPGMSSSTQYIWLPENPGQIVMIQNPQENVNPELQHGGISPNHVRQAQSMQYGNQNPELHHGNRGHLLSSSPNQLSQPQSVPYTYRNPTGIPGQYNPSRNPVQQIPSGIPGQYNHIISPVQYRTPSSSPQDGQYRPVKCSPNNPLLNTPEYRLGGASDMDFSQYKQGPMNHYTQWARDNHQYATEDGAYQPRQSPVEDPHRSGMGTSDFQSHRAHQQRTGTSSAAQPHSYVGYHGQHQHRAGNPSSAPSRFNPNVPNNYYFASHQPIQNDPNDERRMYVPQEMIIVQSPNQSVPKHTLQLDVEKAKQGIPIASKYAQTAPVMSPKLTSPPYKRATSCVTTKLPRHSVSSASAGSRSTPKSQLEEQERAFEELKDTAKDALSQHEGSNVDLLEEEEDQGLEVAGELDITGELSAHDWQSIATYLEDNETDRRIQVTFRRRGDMEKEAFKMSFARSSQSTSWELIIDEELSRHTNELSAGLDRFCLKLEDGTLVDLNSSLGEEDIVVYVEPADERDCWWVEQGMIMKSSTLQ